MAKMLEYTVSRPIRGRQYFQVNARSKAEAKRLVDDGHGEAMDFEIEHHGKASWVGTVDAPDNDFCGCGELAALGSEYCHECRDYLETYS